MEFRKTAGLRKVESTHPPSDRRIYRFTHIDIQGSISALDFCLIEAGPGAGSSHSGCRLRRAAFMRLIGQLPRAAPSGCWGPQEPITPTWTRDDYTTTNPKVIARYAWWCRISNRYARVDWHRKVKFRRFFIQSFSSDLSVSASGSSAFFFVDGAWEVFLKIFPKLTHNPDLLRFRENNT